MRLSIFKIILSIIAILNIQIAISSETKKRHPLLPRCGVFQYAGSIGSVAGGFEWQYGKRRQWRTAVLIGYVPKRYSNREKASLTVKQTFSPWQIALKENITYRPLNCGLFLNTIYSSKFWVKGPNKYPEDYYQFSTHVRPHIFAGQEIEFKFRKKKLVESVSLYYEFNTCDIYLCSYFVNMKYLRPKDIICLGIGGKIFF